MKHNPHANVLIELFKGTSLVDFQITKNTLGEYTFSSVEPGDYVVKETNLVDYPKNVRDGGSNADGEAENLLTNADNLIKVTLIPCEVDSVGNDFVDSNNGSFCGVVKDDQGTNPALSGVEI